MGASRAENEIRVAPELALAQVGELRKLSPASPAIDASASGFDWITDDIDGQRRQRPDVGADELSSDPVAHRPLVPTDVGPDAP
jgi:hypothetical protein